MSVHEARPDPTVRRRRAAVIQGILSLFEAPSYLEVGVSRGATFHRVRAARKVAVDPSFRFDVEAARRDHPEATYHEVPSDRYFGALIDPGERFDVIFIDGMHTFEQTLRDLLNALLFWRRDGVIVIDDVHPSSYAASVADLDEREAVQQATGDTNAAWMGDVFRLVYFIDTMCQQFSYATTTDNHGQLVMWQERRAEVTERSVEGIGRLTYGQAMVARAAFRFAPLDDIVQRLREAGVGRHERERP
jgi:Methyltransferase domain